MLQCPAKMDAADILEHPRLGEYLNRLESAEGLHKDDTCRNKHFT